MEFKFKSRTGLILILALFLAVGSVGYAVVRFILIKDTSVSIVTNVYGVSTYEDYNMTIELTEIGFGTIRRNDPSSEGRSVVEFYIGLDDQVNGNTTLHWDADLITGLTITALKSDPTDGEVITVYGWTKSTGDMILEGSGVTTGFPSCRKVRMTLTQDNSLDIGSYDGLITFTSDDEG